MGQQKRNGGPTSRLSLRHNMGTIWAQYGHMADGEQNEETETASDDSNTETENDE